MKSLRYAGCLLGASIFCASTSALADTQSYIDLQAGLGYSTNPLLTSGSNSGSAFGRISAYGFYGINSPRGASSITGYVENSSYLHRYSNKQVFSLNANTSRSVNEKLTLFGSAGFSGDFGAQLSSRFYGVPTGSLVADPLAPQTVVIVDPELYGLNQRQYRLSGQVGASVIVSATDSVTASLAASHLFVEGSNVSTSRLNYTQYDSSLAYNRQINERVTVGGRLIAQYTDYSNGGSITSVGPQATVRARLSDDWDASAAVGFVRSTQKLGALGGSRSSIDLALDGSLCRNLEYQRLCAQVSRRTQSSITGGAPTATTAGFNYYRRLGANDTIQASAAVSRSNLSFLGVDQHSTFYTLAGSYDRKINDRFSTGLNAAARKLASLGPDPKTDIGGSVFIRYRIGDVR